MEVFERKFDWAKMFPVCPEGLRSTKALIENLVRIFDGRRPNVFFLCNVKNNWKIFFTKKTKKMLEIIQTLAHQKNPT